MLGSFKLASLLALSSMAVASQFTIGVGQDEVTGNDGVGFDPSRTVTNVAGDTIVFTFLEGNHQVVQVDYNLNAPCAQNGGFDTGPAAVANGTIKGAGPTFTFTITNQSQPLFFADIGGDNCLQGAIFCANNEDVSQSCNALKTAALNAGTAAGVPSPTHSFASSGSSSATVAGSTAVLTASAASTTSGARAATGTASPSASASASGSTSPAGRKELTGLLGALAGVAGLLTFF